MQRKLTLWAAVPYIVISGALIAVQVLAPGLIGDGVFFTLITALALIGVMLMVAHAIVQIRSGEPALMSFCPIAAMLLTMGLSFHKEIYVGSLQLLAAARMDSFDRGEGVRFARADDGRFHPRVDIGDTFVDFVVDTDVADIVLTLEDARRIGFDPSSLTFDQKVQMGRGVEKAASVRLYRLQVGSIVIDDVPAKVTVDGALANVLGMAFFDRLSEWQVRDNQLMIVQ